MAVSGKKKCQYGTLSLYLFPSLSFSVSSPFPSVAFFPFLFFVSLPCPGSPFPDIQLGNLGKRCEHPSRSWQSQADKQFLVHSELKIIP